MTPCEKLGYKVGDRFRVLNTSLYQELKCEYVTLDKDDGSYLPFFTDGKYKFCFGIDDGDLEYMADTSLKTGDTIERDGKKYRVTLEEIPQYDFKPGMVCQVDWDGSEYCSSNSKSGTVIYLCEGDDGYSRVAYATNYSALAQGFVKTSNLRPE